MLYKNQNGFSLAEVIVAAAMLGAVSLGVMQLMKNVRDGQATAETKMEELELRRIMMTTLMDSDACKNTFVGTQLGGSVGEIKNSSNTPIFKVGETYGNRTIKIREMRLIDKEMSFADGTKKVDLMVSLDKMKQSVAGGRNVNFKMEIRVKLESGSSNIAGCFVDNDAVIETACESLSGIWRDNKCELPQCPEGQLLQAINIAGVPICKTVSCPPGHAFRAFEESGTPICEPLNVYQ